jgi:hypothetical protein
VRHGHQRAIADRSVRLVLVVASVCVVLLATLVICVLVASALFPEGTRWLLSGGSLMD